MRRIPTCTPFRRLSALRLEATEVIETHRALAAYQPALRTQELWRRFVELHRETGWDLSEGSHRDRTEAALGALLLAVLELTDGTVHCGPVQQDYCA